MSFIGVICERKMESYIKQILERELPQKDIIFLKKDTIRNYKNITFETICIFSNDIELLSQKEIIKGILEKAKYLIINTDEEINLELMNQLNINVVTYGFNSKSTVTASSVEQDEILICIQRSIQDKNENKIEPQEIRIPIMPNKVNSNVKIGVATLLIVYEKESFIL